MQATKYPLQWPVGWPRASRPKQSAFKRHTVSGESHAIISELKRLGAAGDHILSTNLKYRNDGGLYSGQRPPEDKGVAVYFTIDKQQMVIACDTYDKIEDNLYAIVRTIQCMRMIRRDGCSELMTRAFTGFKALPQQATQRDWWEVLLCQESSTMDHVKTCYRHLAKKFHPDTGTVKDNDRFIEINNAYETAMKQFQG